MIVRQKKTGRPALSVERLDRRELMAAGVTATLNGSVLSVVGTSSSAPVVVDVFAQATPWGPAGFVVVEGVGLYSAARVQAVSIVKPQNEPFVFRRGPSWNPVLRVTDSGAAPTISTSIPAAVHTLSVPVPLRSPWRSWSWRAAPPSPPIDFKPRTPTPALPVQVAPAPLPTPPPAPVTVVTPPAPPSPDGETAAEQALVDAVNQARVAGGLAPLAVDAKLAQAAHIHANDMARLDLMQHDLPGVAQPTLRDRATFVGYSFSRLAENIAFNFADAESVMSAWMGSTGHQANILGADFTQVGVGIAYDAAGDPYYCVDFGRPA